MVLRFGRTFQVVGTGAVAVVVAILGMAQTAHVFTELSNNVASLLNRAYVTDATPHLRLSASVRLDPTPSNGAQHDAAAATPAPPAPFVQGPRSVDSSATAQSQATAAAADALTEPARSSPRMSAPPVALTDQGMSTPAVPVTDPGMSAPPFPLADLGMSAPPVAPRGSGATIGSTDDRGVDATISPAAPAQFADPADSSTVTSPYVFPQAAISASETLAAITDAPAVRAALPTPHGIARSAAHAATQHRAMLSRVANARDAAPQRRANGGSANDGHGGNDTAARVGSIRADIARYNAERATRRETAARDDPYRHPPPHDWPYSR